MSNINQVLEASSRVLSLRAQLSEAEAELARLSGVGPAKPAARGPIRGRRGAPVRGTAGASVAQRVLNMVANSGRQGIARRDLVAVIGKDSETAIHSALKAHQQRGYIENDSGLWVITAKYGEEIGAIPAVAAVSVDTRPMRAAHPAGGEYLQGPGQ